MPIQQEAEPIWDIAHLFPAQGFMDEEEYLALDTNHLVEFSHGHLEVLPMPSLSHQLIVQFLYDFLKWFSVENKLGTVLFAPMSVLLWPGKYREPDIIFISAEHDEWKTERCLLKADLVMEIVSPDDRQRDLVIKRREYAQAGIPEYWIVDPQEWEITVLTLTGGKYAVHGVFVPGERADSALLAGFNVDVAEVFAAAER
jgi:Uma2 family endonuclease